MNIQESQACDAKKMLEQFDSNSCNRYLIKKYLSETFFDVVGKACSEIVQNNFLEWFFKQEVWNADAIKWLILTARAQEPDKSKGEFPQKLNDLDIERCKISNIEFPEKKDCWVNIISGKKKSSKKMKKGYPDLVIDCRLIDGNVGVPVKIVIENKVDSPEANNQTWVYYTYYSNDDSKCQEIENFKRKHKYQPEDNNEVQLFLYLAPEWNNKSSSPLGICDKFIRISYQNIYDKVFKVIAKKMANSGYPGINERQELFLKEYMQNLINPFMNRNGEIKSMAYEKDDTAKLKEFFETNLSLFKLAAEVAVKEEKNAEKRDNISEIIQGIDSLKRNKSLYNLVLPNGDNLNDATMKEIALKIVSYLLDKGIPVTAVNTLLPNEVPLISAEKYEEKRKRSIDSQFPKRWDNIKNLLYLSNQWTCARFDEFISMLSEHHKGIEIIKVNPQS